MMMNALALLVFFIPANNSEKKLHGLRSVNQAPFLHNIIQKRRIKILNEKIEQLKIKDAILDIDE